MKNKKSADYNDWLKVIEEEHCKCIRCEECAIVCPVYLESSGEQHTAREKLAMIKALSRGNTSFSKEIITIIEHCLICTHCANQCPSEVHADKVIAATRRVFAQELGLKPAKKVIGIWTRASWLLPKNS